MRQTLLGKGHAHDVRSVSGDNESATTLCLNFYLSIPETYIFGGDNAWFFSVAWTATLMAPPSLEG